MARLDPQTQEISSLGLKKRGSPPHLAGTCPGELAMTGRWGTPRLGVGSRQPCEIPAADTFLCLFMDRAQDHEGRGGRACDFHGESPESSQGGVQGREPRFSDSSQEPHSGESITFNYSAKKKPEVSHNSTTHQPVTEQILICCDCVLHKRPRTRIQSLVASNFIILSPSISCRPLCFGSQLQVKAEGRPPVALW